LNETSACDFFLLWALACKIQPSELKDFSLW